MPKTARHAQVLRATGIMSSLTLLLTLFVAIGPASPAYAGAFDGDAGAIASPEPKSSTPDGTGSGPECDGDLASPDKLCGYASFNSNGNCNATRVTASGLPEANWQGFERDSYSRWISAERTYTDPYDGSAVTDCPIGVNWVDRHSFELVVQIWVKGLSITLQPNETRMVYNSPTSRASVTNTTNQPITGIYYEAKLDPREIKFWTNRSVTYSPVYQTKPARVGPVYCPTQVGPGKMVGPYGNAATPWPVQTAPGVFDPLTMPREWRQATKYSSIGVNLRDRSFDFVKGSDWAMTQVLGCGNLGYKFKPNNSACYYPANSDVYNTNSPDICQFTPGNYQLSAEPKETACYYVYYPKTGDRKFLSCTRPYECVNVDRCFGFDKRAYVLCNGTSGPSDSYLATNPSGKWAPSTHNFADCGQYTPRCVWSNTTGAPGLTDPSGAVITAGSMANADGKRWRVRFPNLRVTGTPTVKDKWMQFIVAGGSQPVRTGSPMNAANQPVFGSTSATATSSGNSLLTRMPSSVGYAGWTSRDLYLRFNQASSTAAATTTVGQGEVTNPVSVVRGSLIPFGVYAVFHFTYDETVTSAVGGTAQKPTPGSCVSRLGWLYPVSGRVTG